MPVTETIESFAARVGLPDSLIRQYVKQGKLPHIITGKIHVRIHVESALDALRAIAENTANERGSTMPEFLKPKESPQRKSNSQQKPRGRLPDSIRLANSAQTTPIETWEKDSGNYMISG